MSARVNKRRRLLAGAVVSIAWWALLGGVWMLLVDTVSTAEVLCAVAAALAGVLVTRLVFDSGIASMRPAGNLPLAVARQLARVPADLWLLAVALARALAGRRRPGRFYVSLIGDKALLTAAVLVVCGPVLSHATARAGRIRERGAWNPDPRGRESEAGS